MSINNTLLTSSTNWISNQFKFYLDDCNNSRVFELSRVVINLNKYNKFNFFDFILDVEILFDGVLV